MLNSSSLGARLEGRSQECSPFSVGKQGTQAFKAMSPGEITQCLSAERGLRIGPGHPNAVVWRREEAEGIVRALDLRARWLPATGSPSRGPAGRGVRVSGERADSECGCPSGGVGLGQRWGRGPGALGAPRGRPEKPGQTRAGLGGDGVSWGQAGTLAMRCREKCRDEEASTPRLPQPQSAGSLRARRAGARGRGAQPGTAVPGVPSARFRGGSAGPGSSYGVLPRRRGLRCIFHLFSALAEPAVAMGKRHHQKDKM